MVKCKNSTLIPISKATIYKECTNSPIKVFIIYVKFVNIGLFISALKLNILAHVYISMYIIGSYFTYCSKQRQ